eukprot:m.46776 g.46776  ORF g.46776 m.46776 type:complete len:294 (+) comp11881_c0_seq1:153-1034(+)
MMPSPNVAPTVGTIGVPGVPTTPPTPVTVQPFNFLAYVDSFCLFVYFGICLFLYKRRQRDDRLLVQLQSHAASVLAAAAAARKEEQANEQAGEAASAHKGMEPKQRKARVRRDQQKEQQHQQELEMIRLKNQIAKQKREARMQQEAAARSAARRMHTATTTTTAASGSIGSAFGTLWNSVVRPVISLFSERKVHVFPELKRNEVQRQLAAVGSEDGLYLISRSLNFPGDYELAVCHGQRVHHYLVRHLPDASYGIEDGIRFSSLEDLVEHYSEGPDGLCCRLRDQRVPPPPQS